MADVLESISLFESKFTGRRRWMIPPAPPKTQLKQYCGATGITPEQWKGKLAQMNTEYALGQYQMKHHKT